jgi:hypothetical protein
LVVVAAPAARAQSRPDPSHDLVAVGVVQDGKAVLLATLGLAERGRQWRLRSFDTSDLGQPLRQAVLTPSATKMFLQSPAGGIVVDLTRQRLHNEPLQWVDPQGPGDGRTHRLPGQRFVVILDGRAHVIDDLGRTLSEYPILDAIDAAITNDGVVLYLTPDRTITVCGEDDGDPTVCRESNRQVPAGEVALVAGSFSQTGAPRFLLLVGSQMETRIVDPNRMDDASRPMRRTEAALRATMTVQGMALPEARISWIVSTLEEESADTQAAKGKSVTDWRFFRVAPDEALYAPVLEVTGAEQVFPDRFSTLPELMGTNPLSGDKHEVAAGLFNRYLRWSPARRRERCTIYFRTQSTAGSWIIQYWLYFPFDVGGLGSHLHDPEHVFVEVDKLGGTVRKVIGAAHGFIAPNNTYTADLRGATAVELPIYVMVEQHKHATAPDIDRDLTFTPGIDENEYKERAKVWGVRDVIGTNNNQLMSFDRTMSAARSPEHFLAPLDFRTRYPDATDLHRLACCRLEPIVETPGDKALCDDPTLDCARRSVTVHPDYLDARTILKDWVFPHAFMRATWGLGLRRGLHTVGLGYAVDLDRMPGLSRVLPLPGRVGAEVFGWRQDTKQQIGEPTQPRSDDPSKTYPVACLAECNRTYGVGAGVRYEQFLSNLFGIYSSLRVYSLNRSDVWITFGPMAEVPLGDHSNINFQAGLAFHPYGSPRFEMKVSLGVWKPRTAEIGLRARRDGGK